jgi:predicted ester cyclase
VGIEKNKELAAATATSTAAVDPARAAQDVFAASIGTTSAALATATAGQKTTADAAANAAAKMYVENDAAGLLKTKLDELNGKAINAAQAQNSFDSSLANMGDHITTTGKKITFTTTSIGDMSTASVALRGQLNSQVTNLENVAEANRGAGASTDAVSAQMKSMRQQIIDNAVAHGVNKDAVTAYIDKLLAIPSSIPPTQLDIDTAAAAANIAAIKAQVASIAAQPIVLSFTANYSAAVSTALAAQRASITLNLPGHAAGGLIAGLGSGTSDSILGVNANGVPITRVSTGEFVVNAAATARNRAQLEAINSGHQGAGSGGGVQIDVHPSTGMNEEAFAMDVFRRFNQMAAV